MSLRLLGALIWLALFSAKNRARRGMALLRRPRYLLLAGGAVGWLTLSRLGAVEASGASEVWSAVAEDEISRRGVALAGAVALCGVLGVRWVLGLRGLSAGMSHRSAPLLLSAPLTPRGLLHLRVMAAGARALLAALLAWGLGAMEGLPLSGAPLALTVWLVGLVLALHEAVAFAALAQADARRTAALSLTLRAAVLLALVSLWALALDPWPPLTLRPEPWQRWIAEVSVEGAHLLAPLMALGGLAAQTEWAGVGTALVTALPLLGGLYLLMVMLGGVHPGQVALARGRDPRGRQRLARRLARRTRRRLPLAERGPRWRALAWITALPVIRNDAGFLFGFFGALIALALTGGLVEIGGIWRAAHRLSGAAVVVGAALLPLMGPGLLRADLSALLVRPDLVKALPVRGAEIIRAAILAPAGLVLLVEAALLATLALRAALGLSSGPLSRQPGLVFSVAPFLVGLTLLVFTARNAALLLFPGWLLSPEARAGVGQGRIEADAGSLVGVFAYGAVGAALLLPPALLALALGVSAAVLSDGAGLGVAPWAFLVAALVEVEVAIRVLGRTFEREYDPTA